MSEEKKNIAQESLKLDKEELEYVAGGEAKRIKPVCPHCGSDKYYSYIRHVIPTGAEFIVYVCPDCNYTDTVQK